MLAASTSILAFSPASANADPTADLAVTLDSIGSVLLAGARYTVTITNHGPDQLDSATVVVRLDPRFSATTAGEVPCPLDRNAATLTCTFGPLPAGGSASVNPFVYYSIKKDHAEVPATATRIASNPADPNSADDSDSTSCTYRRSEFGQTWPPAMICGG